MNKTTKQLYGNTSFSRKREWISLFIFIALMGLTFAARAQEGSQGNATVFAGAQATFFGNHDFLTTTGIAGQKGIIGTERTTSPTGTGYGVVNYAFVPPTLVVTGADDANHVDGYVRNLVGGKFVYPVGDNGFYGPFAATAAGTTGAYFHVNATSAVTDNLNGTNYPILPVTPSGLAFPTTTKGADIATVSTVEYWDIDGANATPITLTWDAGSNVAALTTSKLAYLTIVGWDGTRWVRIPSKFDATSVLGGTSDVTTGSITTTASIVPDNYTIYTLAAVLAPDLTPFITISPSVMAGTTTFDTRIRVLNLNTTVGAATTGALITVRILKTNRWNFVWNGSATTNSLGLLNNSVWTYNGTNALYHIWTTTDVIAKGGSRYIGFTGTFIPGATTGTQPITATILYPSGGEIFNLNQTDVEIATFYP